MKFAVAPHFHLSGTLAERLEGDATQAEPASPEQWAACGVLFAVPAHLRAAFWAMLERQAADGGGDFVAFAGDLAAFLAFKGLPAPVVAAFELVVRPAEGEFDGAAWAVVNLGETATAVLGDARLRLGPGEGCRLPGGASCDVRPTGEEPAVLVVVRAAG